MKTYLNYLKGELSSWKGMLIVLMTLSRIYYGFTWLMGGMGKITWLTDGELNSQGYVGMMATNLATDHGDPFMFGRIMSWVADTFLVNMMPGLTDILVVVLEIVIGLFLILGLHLFWTILAAVFLNLQFFAAGSTNNFGYMVTNLAIWQWSKWFGLIGLDGYLAHRQD